MRRRKAPGCHFFEVVVGSGSREEKRLTKGMPEQILGMVGNSREELEAMVLEQHGASGIEGFREAVRSNLLEVHPFRQTPVAAGCLSVRSRSRPRRASTAEP